MRPKKRLIRGAAFSLMVFSLLGLPGYAQNNRGGSKSRKNAGDAQPVERTPTRRPPGAGIDEYIVGEADVLRISVWKEQEVSQTVVVRPDGNISLPLVNELRVSGMTPRQIQALLEEKLKNFLQHPEVTVTVAEIRSKVVYISGEVAKPGAYPLLYPMTVLQLIATAGGLTPYAKPKNISILRQVNGQEMRFPFNYLKVIRGRSPRDNISLLPGDTIVVP
jgi:polysaccharide export outer membrane protein